EQPTEELLLRLREIAAAARELHRRQARARDYRRDQDNENVEKIVRLPLYRFKRALALAGLLTVRRAFARWGLVQGTAVGLQRALGTTACCDAVERLVRHIKASRVGINMMDLSTVGAIAPYNHLLGGKLIALLLASPEVRLEYAQRYGNTSSVIASAMKGER